DLRGYGDVEAVLARKTIGYAAKRGHDRAQRAIIHVHNAPPDYTAPVDAKRVAPVDVVVDHRSEQVVGRRDGVEIAGEVQVDVRHRHDLRVAAAGGAALHAKGRTETRLAQA